MTQAARKTHPQQPWRERRGGIGLSFSGGGFRAASFSLGTLTLLQDLGLLAQAKVMSSVSGGSLALAAYLCAKAGSGAQKECDFAFEKCFYQPLMSFLEQEQLAVAFVDLKQLLGGGKLILKAADATHQFLNELLNGRGIPTIKKAVLGDPTITAMLANTNLSPDYIFFNATNITSLDLFRFGIQKGNRRGGPEEDPDPVFVLNRYFLKHNRDSAEGKTLYEYAKQLRIADCVAASFGFPAGFEPMLFPDDFIHQEEARQHFRGDLICDHKPYLAFLDGGLYDNLGLASIEDIRQLLDQSKEKQASEHQPIHYVIATDVDQIPTQYSAYSDPETDRQLEEARLGLKRQRKAIDFSLWLIRFLAVAVIALLALDILSLIFLFKPLISLHWITTIRTWILLVVVLGLGLGATQAKSPRAPKDQLGLSGEFPKEAALNSWSAPVLLVLKQLATNPALLWQAITSRRIGQLMPAFSGYLKRTRSLTYGYLQQSYSRQMHDGDCHLIRNMIFELAPGQETDPDYAAKLITLPIRDYRHEEKLDPISPIARKISRAKYISTLLQAVAKTGSRQEEAPGTQLILGLLTRSDSPLRDDARTMIEELNLLEVFAEADPRKGETQRAHLMVSLLTQSNGALLEDAIAIIEELNLLEADQIWRWLCNNLACFEDDDSSCLKAHSPPLSLPIEKLVAKIQAIFTMQIRDNHKLFDRCLVSLDENTSSYSLIPLICEMATNVPTTLWLKGARWYTPNVYDNSQRIRCNGKWSVDQPKDHELPDPDLRPIDLSQFGPAPAAAICTVAGYVSTCFNLLEFFYAWLGNCSHAQQKLLQLLKQQPFPFHSSERLKELEELPYALRTWAWNQLKAEERQQVLPRETLEALPLLEYPLNRRNGLPQSYWAGKVED